MPVLIILAVIVVFGVAAWYGHVQAVRRREELSALATRLGWSFAAEVDRPLTQRLQVFSRLRKGHSEAAYNTLRGSVGMHGHPAPVCTGDFRYKVTRNSGKGRKTTTHRLSYLLVQMPFVTPRLRLRREGFFDKVAGAIGFDDIDFESKEFSDRFHVHSDDHRFAYDVIDPRMMEFLLRDEAPSVVVDSGLMLIVLRERRWTPDGFLGTIAWTRAFLDQWPRHVVDRYASPTTDGIA